MPWVTVGGAKLFSFAASSVHDATKKPIWTEVTRSPQEALRGRLDGIPAPLLDLLFVPLEEFNVPGKTHVDERIQRVLSLVKEGKIRHPTEWVPIPLEPGRGRDVYAALCLRVNALESICRALRTRQAELAKHLAEIRKARLARKRRSDASSSSGEASATSSAEVSGKPRGGQGGAADACSHYVHQWLDAHLLLCCAIEEAGICPDDGSPEMTALLAAYSPSENTCFHEGELPNLLTKIEACSFFGDGSKEKDPLIYLFSKAVPHRCVVRDVISIIEANCQQDDGIFYLFQALIAASLLGIYRHCRRRPPFLERKRLYRFFFFRPPPPVQTFIDQARQSRGVTLSRAAAFRREFAPTTLAADAPEEAVRNALLFGWLSASNAKAPAGARSKKKYVHQNTVVNVVREFLICSLGWLPHLHEVLCRRSDWIGWQRTVIECMDALRGAPGFLKDVNPNQLPSKTLYQAEREPFARAVMAACASFLDGGHAGGGTTEGSESPLDAPLPLEFSVLIRRIMSRFPVGMGADILPVADVPTEENLETEFFQKGRFPLVLFYGSPRVIREYRAAATMYGDSASSTLATGLVRFLAETSMYQLQLVHAFAAACMDRVTIYAFPLPEHLVRQQVDVLRTRLGISDTDPLPRHMLTSFVCRVCRKFRGALASSSHGNEMPPYGSELVSFSSSCIEKQTDELLRRAFPTWESLVEEGRAHGTLFAWYKANAGIDMDLRPYPPDPSVFSVEPGDLEKARAWLAEVRATPLVFSPETTQPLPVRNVQRRVLERIPQRFEDSDANVSEEEFMRKWSEKMGERFTVGHVSQDPGDTCVVWTCASKMYKQEERKTHQAATSIQRIDDSITDRQRNTAARTANTKRRHDMRNYQHHSMCSRTRLIECNMLGWAVRMDRQIYMACCRCLAYTTLERTHWHGAALICERCWEKSKAGASTALTILGSGTAVKCRQCRRVQKPGERYHGTVVLADQTMTFAEIFLCPQHSKKKSWIYGAPNYQSLSTVDMGIRANWGSLRHWDSQRDYLRSLLGDDPNSKADDAAIERALMRQVRSSLGAAAIDGDDLDADVPEDKEEEPEEEEEEEEEEDRPVARGPRRMRGPMFKG